VVQPILAVELVELAETLLVTTETLAVLAL
jgi:hypothetical protein